MTTSAPRYSTGTVPPPSSSEPPRRRFGSAAPVPRSYGRPTSSSSASGSTTSLTLPPSSNPLTPAPVPSEPKRTRSYSSASTSSLNPTTTNNNIHGFLTPNGNGNGSASGNGAFDITTAADKAQAWLSTWAPKGEGRGREFLNNTLNGVASVASTVSSGLNVNVNVGGGGGGGANGRHESFSSERTWTGSTSGFDRRLSGNLISTSSAGVGESSSTHTSPERRTSFHHHQTTTSNNGNNNLLPPPVILSPSTTPQLEVAPTRKIPQPANLSRLGHAHTTAPTVTLSSNASASTPSPSVGSASATGSRPSISQGAAGGASTSSLPTTIPRTSPSISLAPHGSSNLNPNGHGHNHIRTLSHGAATNNPNFHTRSPSFGLSKSPSASLSRSSSLTARSGPSTRSAGMPYKIGFQPAGVRADRTGDFVEARRVKGEDREKEEGRLGRRWAKLVDLHFNPTIPASQQLPVLPTLTRSSSSSFSISSLTDRDKRKSLLSIDGALDALKPKELLKGFKAPSAGPGGDEGRKRAAEQAIVKWEDDGEVKKCRICQSSFTLSNRKHHCRLCGRIVCSLPPTPPTLLAVQIQLFAPADPSATTTSQAGLPPGTRREKCSLLLVADWKTGRGEEVEEGFVGWMKMDQGQEQEDVRQKKDRDRRRNRLSVNSVSSVGTAISTSIKEGREVPLPQQPKEVQVKGVRVCRECWGVVARKQKMQDRQRITGFTRLYQALRGLQAEIEDLIPEFEDQLEELAESNDPLSPNSDLTAIHKQILSLFTQYEHLSKRISSLSCDEESSQAVVQSAVARTAATFMSKEMVKLQALQKIQKRAANKQRKSMSIASTIVKSTLTDQLQDDQDTGEDDNIAMVLQPLLEQEAQLELYISDANAQRKYEDSKALQEALKEIRAEIDRMTINAAKQK